MAVQNQPSGNRNTFQFFRSWQPANSPTTLWLQEQEPDPYSPGEFRAKKILKLLQWGNEIYVPIEEGMHIGIGVYNGASTWRAYPTYVEALNLYDGGPSQPNDCLGSGMWELRPQEQMVMDMMVNPHAQRGRPLTIVRSGQGFGIGEATFGTQEFRGQIRVYERSQRYAQSQRPRPTNSGSTMRGSSHSRGEGEQTRSFGGLRGGIKGGDPDFGRAAIGAGAEANLEHHSTNVTYNQDAQPVVFLRLEFREDLRAMLNDRFGSGTWSWDFDVPTAPQWWHYTPPTAPQIPVAPAPHRPTH